MKALIIYDNAASALKAISSLRNAESSAGAETPWKIKLWRIDLMRFPSMAGEALNEARDASLILCAVRRPQALPSWMKHWFERWAMHRKIADAAIGLMIDDAHDTERAALSSEMSTFAASHNLTFIASSDHEPSETAPFAYSSPSERTLRVEPVVSIAPQN